MPSDYKVVLKRQDNGALSEAHVGVPLIDQYLDYLAAIGRAATTWSSYAYDLAVFCRWLATQRPDPDIEVALRELTGEQVLRFVEHELRPREDRPALAVRTVYRRVVALAKFFDWAEVVGVVSRNPVPRDRHRGSLERQTARPAFLRVPTPLPRPTPTAEVTAFATSLRTWRDKALVGLLVGAGLRLSEALGVCLADLDWGGQQVFVRHGKGGRQRYAMVPAPTWAALKAYLDTERPEPPTDKDAADIPLFVVLGGPRRGQPLTAAAVQSLFRRQRQRAQTPNVTPHRLRHTCGTHLHQAGMALEFLQEQLGHRRLDSTRLYVHLSNDRLRAAYLAAQAQFYQPTEDQEEPHG